MAAGLLIFPGANPSLGYNNQRVRAKLEFFVNQTTTPKTVYADSGLTTPLAQPVESDAYGVFPSIWADTSQTYTVVWSTADGQVDTKDDLTASTAANAGILAATVVVYNQTVAKYDETVAVLADAVALYGDLDAVNQAVTDAQQAVTDAQAQVALAAAQVALATAAATASQGYRDQAQGYRDQAQGFRTDAQTYAGNAASSATAASGYADLAKATSATVLLSFQTSTIDGDPGGPGGVRLNNASPALATFIYVDNFDLGGNDQSVLWDSFDDSTSTNKGQIYLKEGGSSKLAIYAVTGAVINGTGYRKIPVAYVSGTGTAFTNAATLGLNFARTGDAAANASVGYATKNAAYTVVAADWGKIIDLTGAGGFAIGYTSAAALGAGFYNYLRNSTTGQVTLPTIDGATQTLGPGDEVMIEGDGTSFHMLTLKRGGWTLFQRTTVPSPAASVAITNIPQNHAELMFTGMNVGTDTGTNNLQFAISTDNGGSYSSAVTVISIANPAVMSAAIFMPHYRADVDVGLMSAGSFSSPGIITSAQGVDQRTVRYQHTGGMNAARWSMNAQNINTGSIFDTWVKN